MENERIPLSDSEPRSASLPGIGEGHDEFDDYDDLDAYVLEQDPEFHAALEDAQTRSALLRELTECRRAHHASQSTVAARMGTTQSAVSELEGGDTDPRLSTLQRYARALGRRLEVAVAIDRPEGLTVGFRNSIEVSEWANIVVAPQVALMGGAVLSRGGVGVGFFSHSFTTRPVECESEEPGNEFFALAS